MRVSLALLVVAAVFSVTDAASSEGDRTMTKVVKLLQEMLDTSQADGRADTEIFAKFKCYCDSNTAKKTASIADLTSQISTHEGQIETLSASSGKLSTEVASLDQGMTDNESARDNAKALRDKANADFKDEEADSIAAVEQMDKALETLSAIGADQTALASVRSHQGKFMGTESDAAPAADKVPKLSEEMKKALKAATVFLSPAQRKTITGFIQSDAHAPGDYSSQSGEIVGILKNMRDTFKANLATARGAEAKSLRAHEAYTATMESEHGTMSDAHASKQDQLGSNDADLGSAKDSLESAVQTKAEDEDFMAQLTKTCADKTAQYEDLKMVRANEEAAIAQAISILNSDEAFDSFGDTAAASSGATGFIQLSARKQVKNILEKTARKQKSLRLAKIASQVEKNPFAMVIKMIKKSMKAVDEEEKKDDDTKSFCDDERTTNDASIESLTGSIDQLTGEIDQLTTDIEEPEKGLKATLAARQQDLADNKQSQADETASRAAENAEYRKTVANLVVAEETIEKALSVLTKFYDWLERKQGPHHYDEKSGKDSGGATIKRIPEASVDELESACSADPNCAGFNTNGILKSSIQDEGEWYDFAGSLYVKVQDASFAQLKGRKEDPAPPTDEFKGGQEDKGHDALNMLEFILSETKAEEKTAHEGEEKAQADYEDMMTEAKKDENELLETIAKLEENLANKEKERTLKNMNKKADEKERKAAEGYLLSIKPGCDFMDQNIDARKSSRRAEKSALKDSLNLMEGTPEYKEAAAAEEAAALGACADACVGRLEHAECKACQGDTTLTGYCTSNPDTEGC
jgi:hypothetical protein